MFFLENLMGTYLNFLLYYDIIFCNIKLLFIL